MRSVVTALVVLAACSRAPSPATKAEASAPKPSAAASVVAIPLAPSASASAAPSRCITPETVGAVALNELKGENARERVGIEAARVELRRVLENPADFFATVQATDDLVLLELWHRSAFLPENCNVSGNPGGKCRTLGYDPKKGRITSTKFWQ